MDTLMGPVYSFEYLVEVESHTVSRTIGTVHHVMIEISYVL